MNEANTSYKRDRSQFTLTVYLLSVLWLLLALVQWLIVNLVHQIGDFFTQYSWISFVFFVLAIIMLAVFMLLTQSHSESWLNWIFTVVTVECGIIGLFALVAGPWWPELVFWCLICLLTVIAFILISLLLKPDLTEKLDKLVAMSYVFLIGSIFLYMWQVLTLSPHSNVLYQVFLSIFALVFLMYHAQTLNGGRFAEIRINNYLLATVILFYSYVFLLMLSFYAQYQFKFVRRELIDAKD